MGNARSKLMGATTALVALLLGRELLRLGRELLRLRTTPLQPLLGRIVSLVGALLVLCRDLRRRLERRRRLQLFGVKVAASHAEKESPSRRDEARAFWQQAASSGPTDFDGGVFGSVVHIRP